VRVLFILTLLVGTIYAKSLFSNNNQADNSRYVNALKELVIATQKTRGSTNAYLNGNTATLLLMYTYRDDMKTAIGTMESLPLASDPVINKRSTDISNALIDLNRKAVKLKPTEAFEHYTGLIEKLLMLAQSVSKHGSKDLSPFGQNSTNIMMEDILPLTEYIGQLRGLGSGIIAKGTINEEEKMKVLAVIVATNKLSSKFQTDMTKIISQHKEQYPANTNTKLDQIKVSIQKYTDLVKTKVLTPNENATDSDPYFKNGTQVIDMLVDNFDLNNKAILNDSKGWL